MVARTLTALCFLLLFMLPGPLHAQECRPRSFGSDSVVCVCDAHHCDLPGRLTLPDSGHFTIVTSSRDGLRFSTETRKLDHNPAEGRVKVVVETGTPRQAMLGFGAAFTDAATINVAALTPPAQDLLLRSYFAPEGVEYDLCRVPIAGTDFSVRPYSYNDVENDVLLEHFTLAQEDKLYKTNGKLNGNGELLPEMRQPWSNYLVKFVKEYEAAGVTLWGLTTQNHPADTAVNNWNCCFWSSEDMRDWIKDSLGPTLKAAGLSELKIMVGDEVRIQLPEISKTILTDPEAAQYVDGLAVHWYSDNNCSPDLLDQIQQLYPDKFILYTESCIVPGMKLWNDPGLEAVVLGSWSRADSYATSIIESVNHHSTGWIDWNLALDMNGGPNWAGNQVDSPIIVNAEEDEFYKQPMFYVMGHFSKFVAPGSRLVPSWVVEPYSHNIHTAAFIHPEGPTVVVLLNRYTNVHLPAKAIQTLVIAGEDQSAKSHAKTKYTPEGQHQHD
ncbi:Lysosomal acid glucosylceramidase-like 1, partial [Homarus americanus]